MTIKTILITGASSGIGLELAKQFAARGYNLALVARRLELLNKLKDSLSQFSVDVQCWGVDVTDESGLQTMYEQAVNHFGQIDKIVVNAGMANFGNVGERPFAETKSMLDLNLTSAIMTAHYGLQQLRRQQAGGQIVFVSSIAGRRGMPGMASYCASKAGLTTFAEGLRAETFHENIDITVLAPGYINTPIGDNMDKMPFVISAEKAGTLLANRIEKCVKRSYLPTWPWAFAARIVPLLPTRLFATSK